MSINNTHFTSGYSRVLGVVVYDNADKLKDQIIADNKNKSGVYR
jgi:hypothetical protein